MKGTDPDPGPLAFSLLPPLGLFQVTFITGLVDPGHMNDRDLQIHIRIYIWALEWSTAYHSDLLLCTGTAEKKCGRCRSEIHTRSWWSGEQSSITLIQSPRLVGGAFNTVSVLITSF